MFEVCISKGYVAELLMKTFSVKKPSVVYRHCLAGNTVSKRLLFREELVK